MNFSANLTKVLNIGEAVVALLPTVDALVKGVESALPEGTAGAQKLAVVESTLSATYNAIPGLVAAWEDVWPVITKEITALVSAFNAVGVFSKSKSAVTPPGTVSPP